METIPKQDIMLVDKTASIRWSLWGKDIAKYNVKTWKKFSVVALKGARVSHYSGNFLFYICLSYRKKLFLQVER